MAPRARFDATAITLHWLIAVAILGLLVAGFVMTGMKPGSPQQFQLYQIHKSVGMLVLALSLVRLGWRLGHPPPPPPVAMSALERGAAHLAHWVLYGLMLAMPLAGWAAVSTSPFNIPTVLFGLIGLPHLPLPRDANAFAKLTHLTGAWIMIVTLLGHAGAALRHHFILRDDVLLRMLPRLERKS